MPLGKRDKEVESQFEKTYPGRGKSVFYATMNRDISRGKTWNLPEARKQAAKRKHHKKRKRSR